MTKYIMLNHYYNKKLKPYASFNRTNSTRAEIRLWFEVLRYRKTGFRFLRQRPILNYIADFMGKELKLVIEVDGETHDCKLNQDNKRDKDLQDFGYSTLRFNNKEVMENIDYVEKIILECIGEKVKNLNI